MIDSFKLINVKDGEKLFYDGNSMGVFPLYSETDNEIISYLEDIYCGKSISEDKDIENWLQKCISELPRGGRANTKKGLKRRLEALILPIAGSCNLKCPYCFARANQGSFAFPNYEKDDIDFILKQLNKYSSDININLIFFGGEPMLKYDLIEYTVNQVKTKFSHLKVGYSITTNGTLFNKERIKFMRENNFAILLSMDGYDNKFNYRKFINGKSSVPKVLKTIELLKSMEMPFEIRATMTSDNPYIFETYKFFEELEAKYMIAFAYPSENKQNEKIVTFGEDSLKNVSQALDKYLNYISNKLKKKEQIYNTTIPAIANSIEARVHKDYVCSAGYNYFTIMANGDIYSCAHLMNNPEYIIGNISDFEALKKKRISFIAKDFKTLKGCQKCWAKNICNGGCPSQKLSLGLGPKDPFPLERCELERIECEFYIRAYYLLKTIKPS